MNLHENSGVFEDAIRAASDHLEIRAKQLPLTKL